MAPIVLLLAEVFHHHLEVSGDSCLATISIMELRSPSVWLALDIKVVLILAVVVTAALLAAVGALIVGIVVALAVAVLKASERLEMPLVDPM